MRAGAIPLLVWSALIGVLFVIHLLMTGAAVGDPVDTGTFGFAGGLILAWGAASVARNRDTLRRGEPEPTRGPEAIPQASLGAPLIGCAVVAVGFGLVFGSFLVFIGAGVFVAAAGLMVRELRDERRAKRAWAGDGRSG